MTNKEAIETIKAAIAEVEWEYPMDYAVAFDKAIEAIEEVDKKCLGLSVDELERIVTECWTLAETETPEEGVEVLVTDGKTTWIDCLMVDYSTYAVWWGNGTELEETWWLPLPKITPVDQMEIGNLLFGNSRGEYRVPREWQDKFWELIEAYNPGDGYGYAPDGSPFATDRGGYENDTFLINPYYWGDDEAIEAEPNFVYKPTGYEIQWYKYPLRDAWSNRQVEYEDFCKVVNDCIESVYRDRLFTVWNYSNPATGRDRIHDTLSACEWLTRASDISSIEVECYAVRSGRGEPILQVPADTNSAELHDRVRETDADIISMTGTYEGKMIGVTVDLRTKTVSVILNASSSGLIDDIEKTLQL